MRLIDADELTYEMAKSVSDERTDMTYELFDMIVREAPTIDPVRHGRWVKHESPKGVLSRECTNCRCWFLWDMPRNSYCPNCGARMDKEVDDETDTPQTDCETRYCEDCKHYDDVNGHCFFIGRCTYEPKEQTERPCDICQE